MAYMSSYNNVSDFSSYLSNSDDVLNKKQEAAILVFSRKNRFLDGYNIFNELKELLKMFFGDSSELIKNGLAKHYIDLKTYVEENNLIGLILWGSDANNFSDKEEYISTYVTQNDSVIKLQISNICQILLSEYFVDEEYINTLCERTPNFDIYYKSL